MMFALHAATHGYRIIMLGASMPSEGLASVVERAGASALVLSASSDPGADAIAGLAAIVSDLRAPVFVGGTLSVQFRSTLGEIGAQYLGGEFEPALHKLDEALDFQDGTLVQ